MDNNDFALGMLAGQDSGSGSCCNNGNGMWGEGIWSIVLLAIIFGWGRGGFGFGGGQGAGGFDASGSLTRAELFEGFNNQGVNSALTGLRDGQFGIETALCNGFNGVNTNISNLGYQLQNCCCETQRAIDGVNYNMAANTCSLQNTIQNTTRDLLEANNANTQRIVDLITTSKIDDLRTKLAQAEGQLSQANQSANITSTIISALQQPVPRPAYVVPNPYTGYGYGCSCGCACGCA